MPLCGPAWLLGADLEGGSVQVLCSELLLPHEAFGLELLAVQVGAFPSEEGSPGQEPGLLAS